MKSYYENQIPTIQKLVFNNIVLTDYWVPTGNSEYNNFNNFRLRTINYQININ